MITRRGFSGLFAFACLLSSFTPTLAQDAGNWERYSAKGEEFSVQLPEPPTTIRVSRPQRNPFEKPKPLGRMYGAYGDGVVYLIPSFDNPNHKETVDVFINEISDYRITGKAETFEREVKLDGAAGRQYSFHSSILSGILQFYLSKNRAYVVEAISEDMSKPGINRFFASLNLNSKSASKEIPDESYNENVVSIHPEQTASTEKVMMGKDVVRKAIVIAKPEPRYTEEARKRQIAGTVVLRGVFTSTGQVASLRVLSGLPYGMTEKAILAARNIKFIPAIKDGKYVSIYIQLEYTFNLY